MTDNDISKLLPDWTMSYVISQSVNEKIYCAEKETASGTQYSLVKATFIPCGDEGLEELKKEKTQEELVKLNNEMLLSCKKEIAFIRGMCNKGGWLNMRESYDISNSNSTQTLLVSRFDSAQLLDDFIKENGLTQGAILKLGIDLCYAIEHIRRQYNNTIHGSLRPDIIFVDDNCKFRIGKIDINIEQSKLRKNLTAEALAFASPETDADKLDVQSDVYSIGLIMYYYLNNFKLPFEGEMSRADAIAKRLSGTQIPMPAHDIGDITKIVMKACATDKKERYSGTLALRKALEETYFRLQKELEEAKIKERIRLKKLEENNKNAAELEKEKDISAKREVEADEEDIKREQENKNKRKKMLASVLVMVILAFTAFLGFKLVKSEQNKDLGRHQIHLASVYYKETDRADEFAFNYNYDGKAKEPAIVIGGLEELIEGKDYTVEYKDNVEAGEATITVKGIGDYKGSKSRTFNIKPEKPGDISDIRTDEIGESSVVISWSKSKRADKYLIYKYDYDTQQWSDIEYEVDSSQTSIKITKLKPDTAYKFSIKGAIAYKGGKLEPGTGRSIEFKTKS